MQTFLLRSGRNSRPIPPRRTCMLPRPCGNACQAAGTSWACQWPQRTPLMVGFPAGFTISSISTSSESVFSSGFGSQSEKSPMRMPAQSANFPALRSCVSMLSMRYGRSPTSSKKRSFHAYQPPRRAERSCEQRKVPTAEHAFRCSGHKRFPQIAFGILIIRFHAEQHRLCTGKRIRIRFVERTGHGHVVGHKPTALVERCMIGGNIAVSTEKLRVLCLIIS